MLIVPIHNHDQICNDKNPICTLEKLVCRNTLENLMSKSKEKFGNGNIAIHITTVAYVLQDGHRTGSKAPSVLSLWKSTKHASDCITKVLS